MNENNQTIQIADISVINDGFDFTAELYKKQTYDSISNLPKKMELFIANTLQNLHKQISKSLIFPYIAFDFNVFGTEFNSFKFEDFTFWSAFTQADDFQHIWTMLKLQEQILKLKDGLSYNLNSLTKAPLLQVTLPVGLGLSLSYNVDCTLLARLATHATIQTDEDILGFSDLIGKKIKGNIKLRNAFELNHQLLVRGPESFTVPDIKSSMKQTWYQNIDQTVSVTSGDSQLYLKFPITSVPTFRHKVLAMLTNTEGHYKEVSLNQVKNCFWSALDDVLGWSLCTPKTRKQRIGFWDSLKYIGTYVVNHIWQTVPIELKSAIGDFLSKHLKREMDAFVIDINLPVHKESNLKPQHWLSMINDVWIKIRDSTIPRPTKYQATVFNKYVTTFDGKLYKLPDHVPNYCTYFAYDIRKKKFNVIYKNAHKLTVILQHFTISIFHDGKIVVNNTGTQRELPLTSWNKQVEVVRHRNTIHLTERNGFEVKCDLDYDYCTFILDEWSHNTTYGMLGTNDNEPSNDYLLRNGQIASNLNDFLSNIEAEGRDACRPNSVGQPLQKRRHRNQRCITFAKRQCSKYFQFSTSPLATCFPVVNPVQFYDSCLEDLTAHCSSLRSGSSTEKICDITLVYTTLCRQKNTSVSPIPSCYQCLQSDKTLKSINTVWKEEVNSRKLDVVFMVSLHENMNQTSVVDFHTIYMKIVHSLTSMMSRKSINDIQLGLLTYNGDGLFQHPQVHTFHGKLLTTSEHLSNMKHKMVNLKPDGTTHDKNQSRVLLSAKEYSFRSDAMKLVLLITDDIDKTEYMRPSVQIFYVANTINLKILKIGVDFQHKDEVESNRISQLDVSPSKFKNSITRTISNIRDELINGNKNKCEQCKCHFDERLNTKVSCDRTECRKVIS